MTKPSVHTRWIGRWSGRLLAAAMASGAGASYASDELFLSALQAAQRNDVSSLELYAAQMRASGSVLSHYPDYLKYNSTLSAQMPETVVAYAKQNPEAAMTEKLLADYAEVQAGNGRYDWVRQAAPYVVNADLSEQCALAQAQAATGDQLALASLRDQIWLATTRLPTLCGTVAGQLLRSELTKPEDLQQRLWTMLRAGETVAAIDAAQALNISLDPMLIGQIAKNPDAYLLNPSVTSPAEQALYLYALARVAERATEAAAEHLSQERVNLPAQAKLYAYRIVAMSSTGRRAAVQGFNPNTVRWFDLSVGYPFSDEEAQQYARHAIRDGAWESVLRALDVMTFSTQKQREWQYWFARAIGQRKDEQSQQVAQQFYRALATETDYYGLLSRDRLGIKTNSLPPMYQPTAADQQRMRQNIHFQRAFALRNIDAPTVWANREWNWAVRDAVQKQDDGMLLAAAQYATQIGWFDRAIYAAERTSSKFNDTWRYPMPFKDLVVQKSRQVGLDPAWTYGLIRQESRFATVARSHVGASGLMQIMPDTGRWIANRLGEPYRTSSLTDMNTNVRYGTFYLSHILQQLDSHPVLASAGYNAGPTRARRWQPSFAALAADQYTESIPFLETRDYVKHLMTNALHYSLLLGQGDQTIGQRMPAIPARASE
ncbi:MAG: transglycosylase SLT domain-containing protein [Pseudomonadota bacterium]|nr:transglycosylase SLT domain-containing protein [Pseudomonadota bacterium]